MPSPAVLATIGILIGLLSPIVVMLVPNFRWWFAALLIKVLFVIGAVWIINEAVDTASAKNIDNLDLLLGYVIDIWMVIIGAVLFFLSFTVRAFFLARRREAIGISDGMARR